MLSYESDISIDQMINMICKNQNKINNLKNEFSQFSSDMNFIQCEIPKFFNEILFDLDVLISILKNIKCSYNDLSNQNNELSLQLNQSQCDNLSLENMLCNARQSIQELERINQCQKNYINELLYKNNLCSQNNTVLDDKLNNCHNYFGNLPKSTTIDYDNYNLKEDYEKKLNFDYNIDKNCIQNSPRYFEKLLNLSYSYGNNMTPSILNQSSVNSTQLTQMNNIPESFPNSEIKSERYISNYNDKGNKNNNINMNNNMYNTDGSNKQQDNINNEFNNQINNPDDINNENINNENNINDLNDKINKVNRIISEVLKDEKTIQELKKKLGDDFETRIREGDIDEEYLSKIEKALKEIEEQNNINEINNNTNNNIYENNNITKSNNKKWYRPEFKNPYFPNPQKKFKNLEHNDLYNKIKLKKKITDHQYHYKEYPKAWSSSKDYFTNNKSYDKNYKKNTMKIPNIPK